VCDDCKQFFEKIGAHLGIQVWINDKRYWAFRCGRWTIEPKNHRIIKP
jgi:hypothetical protein